MLALVLAFLATVLPLDVGGGAPGAPVTPANPGGAAPSVVTAMDVGGGAPG